MADYKKFRVEAMHNHKTFKVLVKNFFGFWVSGYVFTNYFDLSYSTEEAAMESINGYRNRFTDAT